MSEFHLKMMEIEKYPGDSGAIAFFDALGTRYLEQDVADRFNAWEEMEGVVEKAIDAIEIPVETSISHDFVMLSDSLYFLMKYDDRQSDAAFFLSLSKIFVEIMNEAFTRKILFRGALSCKDAFLKDDMVLGKGVDEVYGYHESTNWIGFAASPSARMRLAEVLNESSVTAQELDKYWIRYDIPMKTVNPERRGLALNWLQDIAFDRQKYLSVVEKLKAKILDTSDVQVSFKLLNTLDFLDQVDRPWRDKAQYQYR